MPHLTIGNKPASSANTEGLLQVTDEVAADAQPAGLFALLLAQQIGETGLPAVQTAVAVDGGPTEGKPEPVFNEEQDQTVDASGMPGDQVNALAAMLQQLHGPEGDKRKAGGQTTPFFASDSLQKVEDRQATPLAAHNLPRQAEDRETIPQLHAAAPVRFEIAKHAELPSGPILPAQDTSQAIFLPAISAAMPGAISGKQPDNMSLDIPPAIAAPLGSSDWADEFSQKVMWVSTQQGQVAELHLNPPNLGPLDVMLKVSDNQATALFSSPHGAVRDAVESALPKLREILADNGIMLGNATVGDQSLRDRNTNGFMRHDSGMAAQHELPAAVSESAGLSITTAQIVSARRHNGMVDTFA